MDGPGAFILSLANRFGDESSAALAAFVGGAAFFEHIFPPVPGDLGVTIGASVAFARMQRTAAIVMVYVGAVVGSGLGSVVSYAVGRWLKTHAERAKEGGWIAKMREQAEEGTKALEKHGAWFLVVSRFIPAVRALVVVGAGYRKMPAPVVIGASTLGGALWQGALFVLAYFVGRNLDQLAHWLDAYNRVVFAVVGVAVVALLARWLWKRKKTAK